MIMVEQPILVPPAALAGVDQAYLQYVRAWMARERAKAIRRARTEITHAKIAATVLAPLFAGEEQEVFAVLLLDTRHLPMDVHLLYRGTHKSNEIRVAEVLRPAVLHNAEAILLAHNHPGGNPLPSKEDWEITSQVREAGKLLNIRVLDHLVFGSGSFYSLAAERFEALAREGDSPLTPSVWCQRFQTAVWALVDELPEEISQEPSGTLMDLLDLLAHCPEQLDFPAAATSAAAPANNQGGKW